MPTTSGSPIGRHVPSFFPLLGTRPGVGGLSPFPPVTAEMPLPQDDSNSAGCLPCLINKMREGRNVPRAANGQCIGEVSTVVSRNGKGQSCASSGTGVRVNGSPF